MRHTMRLTNEEVERQELDKLKDCIGSCIELNDSFLDAACGNALATELQKLDDIHDREFALDGTIDNSAFIGEGIVFPSDNTILINFGDIEVQLAGRPEDYFEEVEDWTINGDLAYLNVGYALFDVNLEQLRENIEDLQG